MSSVTPVRVPYLFHVNSTSLDRLFQLAYCLNDQAHFAWFTSWIPQGQLGGRRRPSMEDDPQWKTTFDGRRPLTKDNLWWKTTFDERQLLMEHNFWWKAPFDWRGPSIEDNFWLKTTFDGRHSLKEDNLLKTTHNGRQHLLGDHYCWRKTNILLWQNV